MSLSFRPELMVKVQAREKNVTRRKWPVSYEPGQIVTIVPGMGRIGCGKVRIVSVDFERVNDFADMDLAEAKAEGFDSPAEFETYWRELHGWWIDDHWYDPIARIEFELVEITRTICECCEGVGTLAVEAASDAQEADRG